MSEDGVVWTGMEGLLARAERVAERRSGTILITGESGVGKEVLARWVHDHSPRKSMPYSAVNLGEIPPEMIASELFGHVRGAFTDAKRDRTGRFRRCDGGTLLLDEIGELGLENQVRLLRAVESGEIAPLGSDRTERVDVRLIAATNRDLEGEVKAERFREDLFFRLNVLRLEVPPLRGRGAAIPELARSFLAAVARAEGRAAKSLADDAVDWLRRRVWPGNVRELRSLMLRADVFIEDSEITAAALLPLAGTDSDLDHDEADLLTARRELGPYLEQMAPAWSLPDRSAALRLAARLRLLLDHEAQRQPNRPPGIALLQSLAVAPGNPWFPELALALATVIAWDLAKAEHRDTAGLIKRWGAALGKAERARGPLRNAIRNHLAQIGIGARLPSPIY